MVYIVMTLGILAVGGLTNQLKIDRELDIDRFRDFFFLMLLGLIAGLRGSDVGTDTAGYLNIFKINNGLASGTANQEVLFKWLCTFIGRFTDNAQWLLIVCAFITTIGVLFFIRKNSDHITLSVFLYVSLYFYFMSFNGVRQYMAIAIMMVAAQFAKERKLLPYIFFMALAIGFHYTCIFGIILWFVYWPNPSLKRMWYLLITVPVGMLLPSLSELIVRIFPRYSTYISSLTTESSAGIMMPIVYTAIFIAGCYAATDEEWRTERNMGLLYLAEIAMLLAFVCLRVALLRRIAWQFQVYVIALIPNLLSSRAFRDYQWLWYLGFVVLGFAYMLYYFGYNWHYVLPYSFYWN